MKLKIDDAGHVVVADGKPVYVHDDGKELPFDAAGTIATISRLNGEAKSHREAKEAAEKALKGFEGLDVSAARKALDIVANLDAKKLVDAGEVEKIRTEAARAAEEKVKLVEARIGPIEQERDSFKSALHAEKIGNAFASSKFIGEKVAIPSDLLQSSFGRNFKFEDGAIVAYDASGNKLFSRAKPGEVAGFDEAIELLVDAYPHRDRILKGSGASGGGARGGDGGHGQRTVTRAQFDKMDPATQRETALKAGKGELSLVD